MTMNEQIVIVNEQDEVIGQEDKEYCHVGDGILHRAITAFIVNSNGDILLTKRSAFKSLWPHFWDTSCSTHVHRDETYEEAGENRLVDEIGISCSLQYIGTFRYHAQYHDIGSENEICALLIGRYDGDITPNPREVSEYKWVSIAEAAQAMSNEDISPWLALAFEQYVAYVHNKTVRQTPDTLRTLGNEQ